MVNFYAIDVSKAFNKVHHCALIIKPMHRNIPNEIVKRLSVNHVYL